MLTIDCYILFIVIPEESRSSNDEGKAKGKGMDDDMVADLFDYFTDEIDDTREAWAEEVRQAQR